MVRSPLLCKIIVPVVCSLSLAGCDSKPAAQVDSTNSSHGQHAQHVENNEVKTADLLIKTVPKSIEPGALVEITANLRSTDGKVIKAFEPSHEKLAHLIIVRKGLDQFAHLHPEFDNDGNFKVNYAFPESGTYHLFLDYKAKGELPETARSELKVEGNTRDAQSLKVNIPGEIAVDKLRAFVSERKSGSKHILAFKINDIDNNPVNDLEPYLGAMGHLVVLSGDAIQYVHAHPVPPSDEKNLVEFEVHYPSSGIYKGWGQFQRKGKVHTIPVVLEVRNN